MIMMVETTWSTWWKDKVRCAEEEDETKGEGSCRLDVELCRASVSSLGDC